MRLMDPAISNEQFESMIAQIEEAVRRVMNHQLAMLEGYRSCVKHHVSMTTEKLDPDRLRARAREEGNVSSKIPLLLDHEIVKIIECRPIAKTVSFIIVENLGKEKGYTQKKDALEESKKKKEEDASAKIESN